MGGQSYGNRLPGKPDRSVTRYAFDASGLTVSVTVDYATVFEHDVAGRRCGEVDWYPSDGKGLLGKRAHDNKSTALIATLHRKTYAARGFQSNLSGVTSVVGILTHF